MTKAEENTDGGKPGNKGGWLEAFAWICSVVAFSPALVWLYKNLMQSQQLRDAMIILVCAGMVMAIESDIRPHRPVFTKASFLWLAIAYVLLVLGGFLGMWGVFLTLFGLSAVLVSAGLAFFDRPRYVYAVGGAFYSFTLLSLFMPLFDFPLRVFAGKLSQYILGFFNDTVLLLLMKGEAPQIALKVNDSTFLVATECNGFGIISSCVVLSIITVLFRKILWLKRAGLVVASVILAYLANTLRIVSIVTLAPHVGEGNYNFMHESLGYFFFALGLIAVWKLCRKL